MVDVCFQYNGCALSVREPISSYFEGCAPNRIQVQHADMAVIIYKLAYYVGC